MLDDLSLKQVNGKCLFIFNQMKKETTGLPSGIKVTTSQFLSMLENYKNCVLTETIAPTDIEIINNGLKKATKVFARVLRQLLQALRTADCSDELIKKHKDNGVRCLLAFVCFSIVCNTYFMACGAIDEIKVDEQASIHIDQFMELYCTMYKLDGQTWH